MRTKLLTMMSICVGVRLSMYEILFPYCYVCHMRGLSLCADEADQLMLEVISYEK